ncbi:hypothetical protein O181_084103 [Austropuccinia psidii MF-1]|uniref:Uncharacterized protein n=1 Tax=Austropuccinia psidii MF-1 TaxID=1389203 RepID=A0A9Q3IKA1_9BASI|nr:hypothetical protein [Austropuccinia psidii MF-1]
MKSQQDSTAVNNPMNLQTIFPKDRKEIFAREKEKRKDQQGDESDSDSVGNSCGNDSYSGLKPNEEYLVEFKNHGTKAIGSVIFRRRKPMTKHLDGFKNKPKHREGVTTRNLLVQGQMSRTSTSKKIGKSHE